MYNTYFVWLGCFLLFFKIFFMLFWCPVKCIYVDFSDSGRSCGRSLLLLKIVPT